MGVFIGQTEISGKTVLAPLAGVTDRSFRQLCRDQGASLAVTEMVSAHGLAEGSERSSEYLDFTPDEHPIAVQVFGSQPDMMAEGARVVAERYPDMIDINCGCPVKKIVNRNAGSALLKDPHRLGKIIAAMVKAVVLPITLKIRSGWELSDEALTIAKVAEDMGAAAIAVHGRTREAKFSGHADWEVVARVKQAVSIPVIGNGDVNSPEAAKNMLESTGCDLVMVGRWAIGDPWLFGRIETYLQTGQLLPGPSMKDRIEMAVRHLWFSVQSKGEHKGVLEMRRHLSAYVKGVPGVYRRMLMTETDPQRIEALLYDICTDSEAKKMEVVG